MSETENSISFLEIYTDGGCIGNPGPGGWAAILVRDCGFEEVGGGEKHTTNNRMEMTAAVEGLRRAVPGDRVQVTTDSKYLHDGITKWIHGWKRRGWKKADGGDVLNRDLWEAVDLLVSSKKLKVSWRHVRGHSGHAYNERCDEIANGFARGAPPKLQKGDAALFAVQESRDESPQLLTFPAYMSLVQGKLIVQSSLGECEKRVKGNPETRYKKVCSRGELKDALEAWGLI